MWAVHALVRLAVCDPTLPKSNAESTLSRACGLADCSGVFVLGLPIVVIGVSFDEAFKEVDQFKLDQARAKAAKR